LVYYNRRVVDELREDERMDCSSMCNRIISFALGTASDLISIAKVPRVFFFLLTKTTDSRFLSNMGDIRSRIINNKPKLCAITLIP
jgi:hypothetical protein